MNGEIELPPNDLVFTEEGKLRHENNYLKERVANLEGFKKNFFIEHMELIKAREKLAQLEHQLSLDKIKERIVCLPVDDLVMDEDDVHTNDNLLSFFHDSLLAENYQDLVASVFHSIDGLGLHVAVQIRNDGQVLDFALDEKYKNESISFLNRHHKNGENIEQDNYIVINRDSFSLVASNLPVEQSVKNRQIKDYLKIISSGANSRIASLSKDLELKVLRKNIYKIFRKTHHSFEGMRDNIDRQTIQISEIYIKFEKNLMDAIRNMNLSEEYLNLIKLIIYDTRVELNLLLTSSLTIDENFLQSIIKLENAYSLDYGD